MRRFGPKAGRRGDTSLIAKEVSGLSKQLPLEGGVRSEGQSTSIYAAKGPRDREGPSSRILRPNPWTCLS